MPEATDTGPGLSAEAPERIVSGGRHGRGHAADG